MEATHPATLSAQEMAAVAEVPARMVSTWAKNDGGLFAELFVEDGVLLLPGVGCYSKKDIAVLMTERFAGEYRGSSVVGEPRGMRIINDQTVVLVTEGGVLTAGQAELSPEAAIRATWVLVKRAGKWQVLAYQNCPRD